MVSIWGSVPVLAAPDNAVFRPGRRRPRPRIPFQGRVDVGLGTPARTQVTSTGWNCRASALGSQREMMSFGATDEGKTFHQENVREMPGHQTSWPCLGDLQQSATQATSRVI